MKTVCAIALAAILLSGAPAFAHSSLRWTFCVAWQPGGPKDVWITNVFAATTDRDRIEAQLRDLLGREFSTRFVAQCPLPGADKAAVVYAKNGAEEFNRKRAVLRSVSAQEVLALK